MDGPNLLCLLGNGTSSVVLCTDPFPHTDHESKGKTQGIQQEGVYDKNKDRKEQRITRYCISLFQPAEDGESYTRHSPDLVWCTHTPTEATHSQ